MRSGETMSHGQRIRVGVPGGWGLRCTSFYGVAVFVTGVKCLTLKCVEQRSWRNYRFTSSVNRRLFDDVHCSLGNLCCQMKSEIHPVFGPRVNSWWVEEGACPLYSVV